jgi:4-hydroxyphenylpyruvate dioxygenase
MKNLGIKKLEAAHWYVHDLERSRRFYTEKLDFAEIARSSPELTASGKQVSVAFQAGDCRLIVSSPHGEGGRAWRWLRKHPDGVGALIFEVEDIEHAWRTLEQREATFIDDVHAFEDGRGGTLRTFNITTPFGSTTFRFVERRGGYALPFPGAVVHEEPRGGTNRFGFTHFDHTTSNFQTMKPALLWMEHVLGMERFWDISFHTEDVSKGGDHGSGLKSVVMWDPESAVKFANNEPYRPFFKSSQINVFNEEHRGDGVQHLAIAAQDILGAVRGMRQAGVDFMPTPGTYYDLMPERLKQLGINAIDEDPQVLRDLQVLVDGDRDRSYLLQIFLKDAGSLYGDKEAGPFFYEIIQRKGDQGFGGGNFRALFESIERQQRGASR